MTLANKFTIARIIMVPMFVALAAFGPDKVQYWAAMLFTIASLTDMIDGEIARRFNQITDFGKLADPIADKLLSTAAMLVLVEWGRMPFWIPIILIARDHVMSGIRVLAAGGGNVIAASAAGKAKTVLQMFSFIFLIMNWLTIGYILLGLAMVMTLWSLYQYIVGSMGVIKRAGYLSFFVSFADKVLISSVVLFLISQGTIGQITGIIIVGRDIIVSGLKMTKASRGERVEVRISGIIRFLLQCVAFSLLLMNNGAAQLVLVIAIIATILSAVDYLYDGRAAFSFRR